MLRVTWESAIQYISISQKLSQINDQHLHVFRKIIIEEERCRAVPGGVIGRNARAIRAELRKQEFTKWAALRQRGVGVSWFNYYTQNNFWVSRKGGLTRSEWSNAIKASMNSMANRATDGRDVSGRHCRFRAFIITPPETRIKGACHLGLAVFEI